VVQESGSVFSWGWAGDGALGLGPAMDGGNLCRAVAAPTQLTALAAHPCRQIACGDSSSFAVAMHGNLILWGTLPLSLSSLCPMCPAGSGGVAGGVEGGENTTMVLWPAFLKVQPPGYMSLPTMGYATRTLLMVVTLPPVNTNMKEQENTRANLQVQQQKYEDSRCKRKAGSGVEYEADDWDRRMRSVL